MSIKGKGWSCCKCGEPLDNVRRPPYGFELTRLPGGKRVVSGHVCKQCAAEAKEKQRRANATAAAAGE